MADHTMDHLDATSDRTLRARRRFALLALVFWLIPEPPVFAAAGDLDHSFGGDGKVTTDFTQEPDWATSMSLQPNGRTVVAGHTRRRFALARYTRSGFLDGSFSGDGKVITNFGPLEVPDRAMAVTVQPDGTIVAAGFSGTDLAVARYNPDGSLDPSFDGDGKLTANIPFSANTLVRQPDGKFVVGGVAGAEGQEQFALARFNTDGTLDTTFDGDGQVFTGFDDETPVQELGALELQLDGKIVAAGRVFSGSVQPFALARYEPNGALDTSFDDDGRVITDVSRTDNDRQSPRDVLVQPDGDIVVAGFVEDRISDDTRWALARYNSDGSLDTSFAGDGTVILNIAGVGTGFAPFAQAVNGLALQPDGKLIAAGSTGWRFALARYRTDGSLDPSFSGNGKVVTNFRPGQESISDVAIQADGRIVAAGSVLRFNEETGRPSAGMFALARYLGS